MGMAEPKMYLPREQQERLAGVRKELGDLLGSQETADNVFVQLLRLTSVELRDLRTTLADATTDRAAG